MFEDVPEQLIITDHVRPTTYYEGAKKFIDGVFEIANNFQLSLKDFPSATSLPIKQHASFRAMMGLLAQNLRSLILIAKAASEGFVEDMAILTRAMHERHISLLLIGQAPETRGRQYLRSRWINELRWLKLSKDTSSHVHLETILEMEEEIEREADRFMKDYFPKLKKPPQYWHGMKIATAAIVAGWEPQHELGYGYLCEFAHGQGYSIPLERAATPFDIVQNSPPHEIVESSVGTAIALFLWGWGELARKFQPGVLDQVQTLLRHYAKAAFPMSDEEINL